MRLSSDGAWLTIEPGRVTASLYADCAPAMASAAAERLRRFPLEPLLTTATAAAWRDIPSTYILCENDEAAHPSLQEAFAARTDAIVRLKTGHSPFFSQPGAVADVIVNASTMSRES